MNLPTHIRQIWSRTLGSDKIKIAILDGSVDLSHPILQHSKIFVGNSIYPNTPKGGIASSHGTHVTGIILGQHINGFKGIAPNCTGIVFPIFQDEKVGIRSCSQINLAQTILQALKQGVHIINISAGEFSKSGKTHPLLVKAIEACIDANCLIISSAGNNGCECFHIPGGHPSVLAIGAMDKNGEPLSFSNWGAPYQKNGLLALGKDILGTIPGGKTEKRSGTSMATAVATGFAALLLSIQILKGEKPDPLKIKRLLLESSIGCNALPTENCQQLLVGRLNCEGALKLIESTNFNHIVMSEQINKTIQADNIKQPANAIQITDEVLTDIQDEKGLRLQSNQNMSNLNQQTESSITDSSKSVESKITHNETINTKQPIGSILPSDCSCSKKEKPKTNNLEQVYAFGTLGVDFTSRARRNSIAQSMGGNPDNEIELLKYLDRNPYDADAVIWTLKLESMPVYSIIGAGPYAHLVYENLRDFLKQQLTQDITRISIPGITYNSVRLLNGMVVPTLVADLRGMYSWNTKALVETVGGRKKSRDHIEEITNFLERIYHELYNLGVTAADRALNYAATNVFQANEIFASAIKEGLKLNTINVESNQISPPDSEYWDVKLEFFNPKKRLEESKVVYKLTIDVSDVVPVSVGKIRKWHVY